MTCLTPSLLELATNSEPSSSRPSSLLELAYDADSESEIAWGPFLPENNHGGEEAVENQGSSSRG